jgi:hypothetical protein
LDMVEGLHLNASSKNHCITRVLRMAHIVLNLLASDLSLADSTTMEGQ